MLVMLYNGSIPFGFVMAVLLYLTSSFQTEKLASRNWMMRVVAGDVVSGCAASVIDENAPINISPMSIICSDFMLNFVESILFSVCIYLLCCIVFRVKVVCVCCLFENEFVPLTFSNWDLQMENKKKKNQLVHEIDHKY